MKRASRKRPRILLSHSHSEQASKMCKMAGQRTHQKCFLSRTEGPPNTLEVAKRPWFELGTFRGDPVAKPASAAQTSSSRRRIRRCLRKCLHLGGRVPRFALKLRTTCASATLTYVFRYKGGTVLNPPHQRIRQIHALYWPGAPCLGDLRTTPGNSPH